MNEWSWCHLTGFLLLTLQLCLIPQMQAYLHCQFTGVHSCEKTLAKLILLDNQFVLFVLWLELMRLIVDLLSHYALMRPTWVHFQEYKYLVLVCCLVGRAMLLYCFINASTCGSIKIYKLGLIKVYKQWGELWAVLSLLISSLSSSFSVLLVIIKIK